MKKVYNKTLGYFTIPPKGGKNSDLEYLASGGQADIFITNNKKYAFKIYHDKQQAIPESKIKELSFLKDKNIITPIDLLYQNEYVGYFMKYIRMNYTLQELFPKAFKNRNNIDINLRISLVDKLIDLVSKVHNSNFLIVDLNARNIVVNKKFNNVFLIDTDSYQTKNHKATAIQESIKDPLVKNNNFTIESDWFSFACLAFELYTNIHPYGGIHPSFNKEINGKSVISQRLENKISVFNKDVKYPPMAVEDFNVIPKDHYNWFRDIFVDNKREVPRKSNQKAPQKVPNKILIVKSSSKLNTELLFKFDSIINKCFFLKGNFIFRTKNGFILENKIIHKNPEAIPSINSSGKIIFLEKKNDNLIYNDLSLPFDFVDSIDGCIYRLYDNSLSSEIISEKNRTFSSTKFLGKFTESCKMGESILFERCLSANRLTILENEKTRQIFLNKDLNDHTIVNAQASKQFALLTTIKNKKYNKVLIDLKTNDYIFDSCDFFDPNIISLSNGINIKLQGESLSVFKDLGKIKKIDNCGLDDGCKLVTDSLNVYFYSDNCFYKTSLK